MLKGKKTITIKKMYAPREDSFLILKHIPICVKSNSKVLDIGTGSAILAREAVKYAGEVTACDINKELISKHKKKDANQKIQFLHSDLFSNIKGSSDIILFNPPYLPSKQIKDIEVDGGKNGTEVIKRFLKKAKYHLEPEGKILIICSNLSRDIEQLFTKYEYRFKKIDQENCFFEKILLYELKMSD